MDYEDKVSLYEIAVDSLLRRIDILEKEVKSFT